MSPSTKPIGKGTCNFPLNMPIEESQIWGRLFGGSKKKSKGEFLKDALLEWALQKHPQDAAKIAEIRKQRAALIGLLLFLSAFVIPLVTTTKKTCKDIRRARIVRTTPVRNIRTREFNFVEV